MTVFFFIIAVDTSSDALEQFTESLGKFTKFSSFRPLATLSYASDIYNGSSIVSRLVFHSTTKAGAF